MPEQKTITLEDTPKFRNFDWEKAKNFYYVAKCGSFANAARFLNISQSALSRQVIYLEQHLGCPLFARHSAGIKLTRKGEELFALVETTFLGFKDFTQNTHAQTTSKKKRKIRIATTHAITSYILSDLIFTYTKDLSHLVFELLSEDHLIDIVLNDVDIAIRPYDPTVRGVLQEELFTLEKKLYASPEYLEKYGAPQTIEDLKNHRLIAFGHPEAHPYSDVNWILKLGMPKGELHEPIFTSNSVDCMIKAVRSGMGIIGSYEEFTILRSAHLQNILPNVKDKKITWYFTYPEYLKKDQEVIALKNFLFNELVLKRHQTKLNNTLQAAH
jgi:DNA-binding transcriptional LysR family regulator